MVNDDNLIRELEKILSTLTLVETHLYHKDRMNAALHMSSVVRATPLASAVQRDVENLGRLIEAIKEGDYEH